MWVDTKFEDIKVGDVIECRGDDDDVLTNFRVRHIDGLVLHANDYVWRHTGYACTYRKQTKGLWVPVASFDEIEIGDLVRHTDMQRRIARTETRRIFFMVDGHELCWHWDPECFRYFKWVGDATPTPTPASPFEADLDAVLADLRDFLVVKNMKYGNSAFEPVRAFSSCGPREQLWVRMDDKISRMLQGVADDDEDAPKDFVGYWVLDQIAKRRENETDN